MPAPIVVVLDDPALADQTAAALITAGYDAVAIYDSMDALAALESTNRIEMLITSGQFPHGKPNGLSLVRMTKLKRPEIKIILTGTSDLARLVKDLGTFMEAPVSASQIVETAVGIMAAG